MNGNVYNRVKGRLNTIYYLYKKSKQYYALTLFELLVNVKHMLRAVLNEQIFFDCANYIKAIFSLKV